MIAAAGAATAVAVDAASLVVLVLAAIVSRRFVPPPPAAPARGGGTLATLRLLKGLPAVAGITALCVVFFAVYGPVEVALPVLVASVLHAGAGALGGYWTLFSVGAAAGALGASRLERFGMWQVTIVSVAGWGICLVPLGLIDSLAVGFGALAAGSFFYGPFLPLRASIIQRSAPPGDLSAVAGASALFTTPAAPIGTALGGPIVAAIGARATLTGSGLVTVAAAALASAVLIGRRIHRRGGRHKLGANVEPSEEAHDVRQNPQAGA